MCQNVKPSCILLWQGMMTAAVATGILKRAKLYLMRKKTLRQMQTLWTGRAKKFQPATDPLPGGVGWPKFNQLEIITTFTYKPSLASIDACNFELSW